LLPEIKLAFDFGLASMRTLIEFNFNRIYVSSWIKPNKKAAADSGGIQQSNHRKNLLLILELRAD
jgi:hypothetical protein